MTDLSGRGVGLDVVKTATERLGGTIAVSTRPGEGSRFTLQLPLATAIIETLMVGVGEHIFAIPCDIVVETFDLKPEDVRGIGKQLALAVRGEVIRFVKMSDLLNIPLTECHEEQIAVVVRVGENLIAPGWIYCSIRPRISSSRSIPLLKSSRGFRAEPFWATVAWPCCSIFPRWCKRCLERTELCDTQGSLYAGKSRLSRGVAEYRRRKRGHGAEPASHLRGGHSPSGREHNPGVRSDRRFQRHGSRHLHADADGGRFDGKHFFVVPDDQKAKLSDLAECSLLGPNGNSDPDRIISDLGEIGNILAGVYLTAIYDFCRLKICHSVPFLAPTCSRSCRRH